MELSEKQLSIWNIDHKTSLYNGGSNSIENLQAVHIKCNRNKGNK